MSVWGELRRRNVFKVGAAYAIVAWLLIQVAGQVLPTFDAPRWVLQTVTFLLILGLPVALVLAWAYEVTPEGIKPSARVDSSESIAAVTGQKLNYVVTGLMAVGIVFLIVDNYVLDDSARGVGEPLSAEQASTAAAGAAATPVASEPAMPTGQRQRLPNSVAVLPFANMSPREEDAYFAAGIHEEILNYLAKLKSLNVIARTSMLQYANTAKAVPEIAEELNVETVMEGSVRYSGSRVRVTTQLIDAATGAHLWSDAYEREFADIFAIQADIAMNVANAMQAEFSPEEQAAIEKLPTNSAAAYDLYLQAMSVLGTATGGGARIRELLDRALEIDPEFVLALGAKAGSYSGELINTAGSVARSQAELEPLIRESAARALELDPENSGAHSALGGLAVYSWRWTEARPSVLRSLDSPQFYSVTANWFLSWSGDDEASIRFAQRRATLNPLDWTGPWNRGIVLTYAGRYDEAAAAFRESIAMAPTVAVQHPWLASTEIARGNPDAARQELQLTERLLGENRLIIYLLDIAYSYSRIGDREIAQRLYDEIVRTAAGQEIGAGGWAIASMAVGDYAEALRWLNVGAEKAARHELDAGMFSLMNLKLNVTNDPVLERPEFVEVRSRLRGD
jgi:TolB-like protein